MTEQQYRVIADRDKGEDPQERDSRAGDRLTFIATESYGKLLVRIERPAPPSELGVPLLLTDVEADSFTAAMQDPPPMPLPTREQIAAAIAKSEDADYWVDEIANWEDREEWEREAHAEDRPCSAYDDRDYYLSTADDVLALLTQPGPPAWAQGDSSPDAYGGEGGSVDPVSAEPKRLLLTHPHDGHGPNDTCFDCRAADPSTIRAVTPQTGDDRG